VKIRQGFVSNSSSTSFCIYGAYVDEDESTGYADKKKKKSGEDYDCDDDYPEFTKFSKKAATMGLEFYHSYEGGGMWVGVAPDNIKDDETGKQFKASVEEKLKKLFKIPMDCSWYTEEISS
jgi:hypothetical protein